MLTDSTSKAFAGVEATELPHDLLHAENHVERLDQGLAPGRIHQIRYQGKDYVVKMQLSFSDIQEQKVNRDINSALGRDCVPCAAFQINHHIAGYTYNGLLLMPLIEGPRHYDLSQSDESALLNKRHVREKLIYDMTVASVTQDNDPNDENLFYEGDKPLWIDFEFGLSGGPCRFLYGANGKPISILEAVNTKHAISGKRYPLSGFLCRRDNRDVVRQSALEIGRRARQACDSEGNGPLAEFFGQAATRADELAKDILSYNPG